MDPKSSSPSSVSDEKSPVGLDRNFNDQSTTSTDEASFAVGWDGDDDPMCPQSMRISKKWVILAFICMGTTCLTCASSIYTATYAQMNAEFGSSRLVATLGLSLFVVGIAAGPMITGPLSEHYGRRPIYLISWSLCLIWLIPPAVATNIETVIIARFFAGLTGSAYLAVAGGTVSDIFARNQIQMPMAMISLAPNVGPSLGPLLGGIINSNLDWRWTHYILLIWAGSILVGLVLFVPETFHPVLLRAKAQKLRTETGDDRYRAPTEKKSDSLSNMLTISLKRPFQLLLLEPMCLCLDLYTALLLGIIYLFFGAFPLVFGTVYDMNLMQIGLTFLGMMVGMLIGSLFTPLWSYIRTRLVAQHEKEAGEVQAEPEFLLPPVIVGGILIPIGLFWFGWTTYSSIHWIVPIIGSAIFSCGALFAFTGIMTFLVAAYPQYAASALAGNAFVRCLFAAAFPLFAVQMYDDLGYHWATSLLAFLTVAMMPFPWLFFRYGKFLRSKSKFAKHS